MITITRKAADKKAGLTVAELQCFRLDLEHAGIEGSTNLKATMGFRGQLTSIEASG